MSKSKIQFSTGFSFLGLLAGIAITLGLPYIILVYGKHLSEGIQVILIIMALIGGGLITLTAAFFGIVIPKKLEDIGSVVSKGIPSVKLEEQGDKKTVWINNQVVDENKESPVDGEEKFDENKIE